MVKKFMKKRSKRVKASKRYKVERKVREHHRKLKKAAKKRGSTGRKGPKDPGIPRILPFRDKVVAEAIEAKAQAEEARRLEKDRARELRKRAAAAAANENPLEALAKKADERRRNFEAMAAAKKAKLDDEFSVVKERPATAYYHDLKKVIEKSDVLLEVIDARDPVGTRCPDIESRILSSGKRLILVMNKIDLVPRAVVQQWLRILQSQLPAVAFKASTQTQRDNLSQKRGGHFRTVKDDTSNSSRCFGAESLLKLLGNYCRIKDVRTSITVGIIGLPNTGKSSLINSLKRTKVCNVGAHAGVTRALQEINLDKHIRMIDSPGVIFAKHLNQDDAVLRNCINPETVGDAVPLIETIVKRCTPRCLMLAYNLPQFETSSELLAVMAQRWGKFKKGGVPDLSQTAKMVLRDWNSGKLGYYTEPPAALEPIVTDGEAILVSKLAEEFDLNAISDEQFAALQSMPERDCAASTKVTSSGSVALPTNCLESAEDDGVITKVDEERLIERQLKRSRSKFGDGDDGEADEINGADYFDDEAEEDDDGDEDDEEEQVNVTNRNRSRKLEAKRRQKVTRKKQNKTVEEVESTENINKKPAADDAYNFDECDVTMT